MTFGTRDDYSKRQSGWTPEPKHRKRERPIGKCPVCTRSGVKLDFHHWDYTNDIGCEICRACHNYAHGKYGTKPSHTAGNEWVPECFSRLLEKYRENHHYISERRVFRELSLPRKHHQELKECLNSGDSE